MKLKSLPLLLFPAALNLALMLLFSFWEGAVEYTYFTLSLLALIITGPLTVVYLMYMWRRHPKLSFGLMIAFALVSVVLYGAIRPISAVRSYELMAYEWGKYPRLVSQLYVIPFFTVSLIHWLGGLRKKEEEGAEEEPAALSDPALTVTLWVNRVLMVLGLVLLFAMPAVLRWYNTLRIMHLNQNVMILMGFYACAPFALRGLWSVEKLLGNIRKGEVFVHGNVTLLRRIRLCCGAVTVLCIAPACAYPPLLFMILIMGFLTLMVNVVCQVMKAAVAIREENDLTV